MKTLENRGIFKKDKNATSTNATNSISRNNDSNDTEGIWICNRCNRASQSPIDTGLPGLPKTIVKQCYSKNNFNGNIYYPTAEFGTGGCRGGGGSVFILLENASVF